ncbi:MAG: YggS family pyridoxal phosphate-dependent enzyme [Calditrichaceae bacterium]
MDIIRNLKIIHRRIETACARCGRNPSDVKLLLATKTVSPENIKMALNEGETLIGENKIQEALKKFEALKNEKIEQHFIGHLQKNKIKDALKFADMIQSVDRLDLVEKLDQRLRFEDKSMNILIQVNTSEEDSKFGVAPEHAMELVKKTSAYDSIHIKGLMTIGIFSGDEEEIRKCFRILRQLQIRIREENIPNVEMEILSMGMSGDLEIAIEEGSTMLRVGTAIFGDRVYPDTYYWNESGK